MLTKYILSFLYLIFFFFTTYLDAEVSYHNYEVIRIIPRTQEQVELLKSWETNNGFELDFWLPPGHLGHPVDVLVNPDQWEAVILLLDFYKIEFKISIKNVEREIINESSKNRRRMKKFNFQQYFPLPEINIFLQKLHKRHPNITKIFSIGNSYQGRPLNVIKIGKHSEKVKPAIWTDAGIHAREWIAPATALFLINELLNNYNVNNNVTQWIDSLDFYFLPVVNPDGYVFTWTEDRFWRKNRRPGSENCFCDDCYGVDANRNFQHLWAEYADDTDYECSVTYPGKFAFSEPEVAAISNFLFTHREKFKVYLTLHSYSEILLLPYGNGEKPNDYQEIYDLGKKALDAAEKVHGKNYSIGNTADEMYMATGISADWAKEKAGIKYSFTLELRDRGEHGFTLPPDQIIPTGEEIWAAFQVIANKVYENI